MAFKEYTEHELTELVKSGKGFLSDGEGRIDAYPQGSFKPVWKPAPKGAGPDYVLGTKAAFIYKDSKLMEWGPEAPSSGEGVKPAPEGAAKESSDKPRNRTGNSPSNRTDTVRVKGVPYSRVGPVTTEGFSQNNHMWWMKKDPELNAYDFGVGMNLHMIAYSKGNCGKVKASPDHLASITRLGVDAAKARAKTLVERGWFKRVDNGKGGRDSENVATYVPTVPEHVLSRGE